MLRALNDWIDRVMAPLPAWLLLFSGMALIGMAVLVPAWVESRDLQWQLSVMTVQSERLALQEQSYREFHDALAQDDPILIERLAFYHLRLKPAGAMALSPVQLNRRSEPKIPTIEELLHRPLPKPGVTMAAYQPINTRLVRLTRGPMRIAMIAAGFLCLVAGLTAPTPCLAKAGATAVPGPVFEPRSTTRRGPAAPAALIDEPIMGELDDDDDADFDSDTNDASDAPSASLKDRLLASARRLPLIGRRLG